MVYETTAFDQFRHKPLGLFCYTRGILDLKALFVFITNSINKVNYLLRICLSYKFFNLVGRVGLEPTMPEAADLQSAGLTNSPIYPVETSKLLR